MNYPAIQKSPGVQDFVFPAPPGYSALSVNFAHDERDEVLFPTFYRTPILAFRLRTRPDAEGWEESELWPITANAEFNNTAIMPKDYENNLAIECPDGTVEGACGFSYANAQSWAGARHEVEGTPAATIEGVDWPDGAWERLRRQERVIGVQPQPILLQGRHVTLKLEAVDGR